MTGMTIASDREPRMLRVEEWAREQVEDWCELCDDFKNATRRSMLLGSPTPDELENHRTELNRFLRITRLLLAEVADPDFRDRTLAMSIVIRLNQLERLWEVIHNSIPDDRADRILREAFGE